MTSQDLTDDDRAKIARALEERVWVRLSDDYPPRRWCRKHERVFCGDEEIAPCIVAHDICPECARPPKRPADVAVQDWWKPMRFGEPQREVLRCTEHKGEMFELDEMCRRCWYEEQEAMESGL